MDKVFAGLSAAQLETGRQSAPITRVNILVDSDHMYTAGDDTGRTIEKTCPWGTQAMADAVLAQVRNVKYQPFAGEDCLLDPAAEVGDGITIGGIYSVLAHSAIEFDSLCAADVSAPISDEVEEEYPYKSRAQRAASRRLAETRSRITKTAEQIRLEVSNEVKGLSASIEVKLDSITQEVRGLDSAHSRLEQKVDSFTLEVSNDSTSSTITLKAGEAVIASKNITMNGLVSFQGLQDGTTTIDGSCIKTGSIDAERINLTGAITWSDLAADTKSGINSANQTAGAALNDAGTAIATANALANGTGGGTFINGTTIQSPRIVGGTLVGSEIYFGEGGNIGGLFAGHGFDGQFQTDLVQMRSGFGLLLSAGTNMRIEANSLWINIDASMIKVKKNGAWTSLSDL